MTHRFFAELDVEIETPSNYTRKATCSLRIHDPMAQWVAFKTCGEWEVGLVRVTVAGRNLIFDPARRYEGLGGIIGFEAWPSLVKQINQHADRYADKLRREARDAAEDRRFEWARDVARKAAE